MSRKYVMAVMAALFAAPTLAQAPAPALPLVRVTADNFVRAESDTYAVNLAKEGGLGKLLHRREPAPIQSQSIIRLNRDTLYTSGVFDLDAGPVTITLPDAGQRFMSLQSISQDHYATTAYGAGPHTLTRDAVGTRYAVVGIRTLVDPTDPEDVRKVRALQDTMTVSQASPGSLETPQWDPASQKKVRDALLVLATTLPDTKRMFGTKEQVDPIRHLIGSASAWGGNNEKDALYLNIVPDKNDGKTVYRLNVKDVPVDGFWSVSLYNAEGYYQPNPHNAYSLNNITAEKGSDGSVAVQFGGCDGKIANCLPTMPGWNYMVRLYRPQAAILSGGWAFPEAQPVN